MKQQFCLWQHSGTVRISSEIFGNIHKVAETLHQFSSEFFSSMKKYVVGTSLKIKKTLTHICNSGNLGRYPRMKMSRQFSLSLFNNVFSLSFFLIFEESLLVKDPVFSKEDAYVLDRKHSYERALQRGLRMVELIKEHQITDPEEVVILKRCWLECTFVTVVL